MYAILNYFVLSIDIYFNMFGTAKRHVSRVGLKPVKALFSIQVETVTMVRACPVQDQAVLSVCFERGGKVSSTSNVIYEKPAYVREVVVPFHEKIELVATLFKDFRTGIYQEKIGKLIFRELIKKGMFGQDSYKGIGRYDLSLHKIMNELGFERTITKEQIIKFNLVNGCTVKIIMTATVLSTGGSGDSDSQSVASYATDASDMSTMAASFSFAPTKNNHSVNNTLSTSDSLRDDENEKNNSENEREHDNDAAVATSAVSPIPHQTTPSSRTMVSYFHSPFRGSTESAVQKASPVLPESKDWGELEDSVHDLEGEQTSQHAAVTADQDHHPALHSPLPCIEEQEQHSSDEPTKSSSPLQITTTPDICERETPQKKRFFSKFLKPLRRVSDQQKSTITPAGEISPIFSLTEEFLPDSIRNEPDSTGSRSTEVSREAFALYDQELRRRAQHIKSLEAALAEQTRHTHSQLQTMRLELEHTTAALKKERVARTVLTEATHKGDTVLAAALSEARDEAATAIAQHEAALAEVKAVAQELQQCRDQVTAMQRRQDQEMQMAQEAAAVAAQACLKRAEAEEEGQCLLQSLIAVKVYCY